MSDTPALAGHVVVIAGALAQLNRRDAVALVERQQGRVGTAVTRATTMLVVGEDAARGARGKGASAAAEHPQESDARRLNEKFPGRVTIVDAATFYRLLGLVVEPAPADAGSDLYGSRSIRSLYPLLREDRLRYLERWGLVRPVREDRHERYYSFADLAVLRQASADLAAGVPFRAVVRDLLASRQGQLTLDFQLSRAESAPTRFVSLPARPAPGPRPDPETSDGQAQALAGRYFAEGAQIDTGDPDQREAAMAAYRRALALDPSMTAALVNLANVHYALDATIEAEALYEKALAIDASCFEALFNLGNVCHDTGRFERAVRCYSEALALDPSYADAHFYLAVTLEKLGRSSEARPHWAAYQRLAPDGEWVELAREFSE